MPKLRTRNRHVVIYSGTASLQAPDLKPLAAGDRVSCPVCGRLVLKNKDGGPRGHNMPGIGKIPCPI